MADLSVSTYMIKPGLMPPNYPFPLWLAVTFGVFSPPNFDLWLKPQATPRLPDRCSAPTLASFPFQSWSVIVTLGS